VPYSVIDQNTRNKLPPTVVGWYSSVREFELTSSYGLFRRYLLFPVTILMIQSLTSEYHYSIIITRFVR